MSASKRDQAPSLSSDTATGRLTLAGRWTTETIAYMYPLSTM